MNTRDFRKELTPLYAPSARDVAVVDIPPLNFLMVDVAGDPNGSVTYAGAVAALFAVSCALKFRVRRGGQQLDYGVTPLEGLWWTDRRGGGGDPEMTDRSGWRWTMMIMQPEFITLEMVQAADTAKKKTLEALPRLRFEAFAEGQAAQLLHIGPFSEEWPNIWKLHDFITDHAQMRGKHHEIYLSDVTRADPSRWRTILRQPMS